MYRSLIESNLRSGAWVVFPGGGGGVGIQGVQLAKGMGMRPIVVDTGASKQKLALEMGAEAFVDFKEVADPAKAVIEIADGVEFPPIFSSYPSFKPKDERPKEKFIATPTKVFDIIMSRDD